jgi:hypothetical protein
VFFVGALIYWCFWSNMKFVQKMGISQVHMAKIQNNIGKSVYSMHRVKTRFVSRAGKKTETAQK